VFHRADNLKLLDWKADQIFMEQLTPEAGEFMFEHDGVKMIDTPMGIFLKDGKPFVGLFKRRSLFHAAPMATMGP
jgi:hypothetical protein